MHKPTLLMIRPLHQAKDFVQALPISNPIVIYAPVLEIAPLPVPPIPQNAQYLLFSSVNGVRFFAQQTQARDVPALCVGEMTAAAARAAGFTAHSANGTAADLLKLVQTTADPKNGPLIYVSGAMVAHDIDGDLRALGFSAQRVSAYEQLPQALTDQALHALRSSCVIPISSPNTARVFAEQTAQLDLSQAKFVFISENALKPLKHTDSVQILAKSPTREAMIAAVTPLL